jgi:hypothetical protein
VFSAQAGLAALAAERAAAERAARGAVLAQVDAWVGASGGPSGELTHRSNNGTSGSASHSHDDGPAHVSSATLGAPASLAALSLSVPKPRALLEGAQSVLARLEAQHGGGGAHGGQGHNGSGEHGHFSDAFRGGGGGYDAATPRGVHKLGYEARARRGAIRGRRACCACSRYCDSIN